MSGINAVMARINQIQSMASRVGGGFGMTLDATIAASTPATQGGVPAVADPQIADAANTELIGDPTPLPTGSGRWQAAIERAADANDIDPTLLNALVWVESDFDPNAVSHAGAIGLAQLMPDTAAGLGVDPYDPAQNLEGGARFLSAMIDRFGRTDLALAAYNAGPARVSAMYDGGPGVPVAEGYVTAVLNRYEQLGGTP